MIEKIKYYLYLYKKQVLLSISFIFLLTIFFMTNIFFKKDNVEALDKDKFEEKIVKEEIKEDKIIENYLYVDIKGEIKKPGVYKLKEGSIVNDVLKLAGGITTNGSTEFINLSKKIKNEMVIVIYNKNDIKNILEKKKEDEYIKKELTKNTEIINDSLIIDKDITNDNVIEKSSKISINNSSVTELQEINGLGLKKAEAIIEYRNINGKFNSIEDLLNVSGIGESTLEKIKEYICL